MLFALGIEDLSKPLDLSSPGFWAVTGLVILLVIGMAAIADSK